jgi:hypothetical protein
VGKAATGQVGGRWGAGGIREVAFSGCGSRGVAIDDNLAKRLVEI